MTTRGSSNLNCGERRRAPRRTSGAGFGSLILPVLLLVGTPYAVWADFRVTKVSDSVVEPTSLTLKRMHPYYGGVCINAVACQQDAVVTQERHQYLAYYDAERRVCLARRKLPAGDWNVLRFTDYVFTKNEDHCTISIGLCPKDGTLHMSFGHHHGALTYRVSRKGIATDPESVPQAAKGSCKGVSPHY